MVYRVLRYLESQMIANWGTATEAWYRDGRNFWVELHPYKKK